MEPVSYDMSGVNLSGFFVFALDSLNPVVSAPKLMGNLNLSSVITFCGITFFFQLKQD